MKSPLSALLALSFLFLAFTTKPLVWAALEEEPFFEFPIALRDGNGDKVLVGQDYLISSLTWGAGEGGVIALPGLNNTCPVDVAWGTGLFFRGNPVRFSPVTDVNGVVKTNTNLNIKFTEVPLLSCNQPTVWKVGEYQPGAGQWFITTDGVEGDFGPETYPNWFYIKKVGGTCDFPFYKLVHCPSKNSGALCSDVGISYENGGRLALSKTSFPFIILKDRKVDHSSE